MATYSGWFDPNLWRQAAGNVVDQIGTGLKIPIDTGLSERIAGGPTTNTGTKYATSAAGVNVSPYQAAPMSSPILGSGYSTQFASNPTNYQAPAPAPSQGGGGSIDLSNIVKMDEYARSLGYDNWNHYQDALRNQQQSQNVDPFATYRSALESSYQDLEKNLDPWKAQQEQGVNQSFQSGMQNIDLQKQAGLEALTGQRQRVETNQVRNLKDLANAIGQSYNTFSNRLGVMGAGDSSASNVMLPYALSRMEAQGRGQVTRGSQDAYGGIDEREGQLNNIVAQESNKLNQERMAHLNSIADWFNNARFQISQAKGQDIRGMAENVLMNAIQQMNQVNEQYTNRSNALRDWATSVSQNATQLGQNLRAVSDPGLLGTLPQFRGVDTSLGGYTPANYSAPVGFGFGSDEKQRQF